MVLSRVLKKISNLFLAGVFCISSIIITNPLPVQAYDEETCYVNEAGNWQVMDADGPTVTVSMYMMMQPEYAASSGFRACYGFWCDDGIFNYKNGFQDTSAQMEFYFRAENAKVVDIFHDYQIWYWSFNIEPATYYFAEPEGLNNITVLTKSLGSPFVRDGYTEAEATVVEDGDHIRLYCMFGDWEWRKQEEKLFSLQAYAEMKNEELSYGKPKDNGEKTKTTIEVSGAENKEEETLVKEENAETIDKSVNETNPLSEAVVLQDPEPEPEKDNSGLKKLLSVGKTILIILFLGGVLYVTRKGNEE